MSKQTSKPSFQLSLFDDPVDEVPQEPVAEAKPGAKELVSKKPVAEKETAQQPAPKKRAVKKRAKKTVASTGAVKVEAAPEKAVAVATADTKPLQERPSKNQAAPSTIDATDSEPSVSFELQHANADLDSLRIDTPHVQPWAQPIEGDALATRLVRASAGTGKTYQLTARLLKILLQGAAPETVLATTFTRKAAGEILNRLLTDLANAADEDNDAALDALRNQVGIPTLSRKVCLQLLETILRNVHRLRICTLDSLFAQLARSFPFELGLPAAWRLTDEIEEVWLRERAIESVVSALDPAEMMTMLSMLGKGEAKRSIAVELINVINATYSMQRQCGPDVWNKLRAPKGPDSKDLTRAAGVLMQADVRQASVLKKLHDVGQLLETRSIKDLVKDTLVANVSKARRTKTEVTFGRSKLPESLDPALDVLYGAVRTEALSLLQYQNEATGNVLAAYDHQVTQLKQGLRSLGFDDVAVRLANQFRSIDPQSLAGRMDGAIDHLLLDEFQDTSPVQWQVLRPLAIHAAATPEVKRGPEWQVERSFYCVGDTKQAIYGWRGGVAEIFDAVAEQIDDVSEESLNTSYRSSPVILDAVERTFRNLQQHPLALEADSKDLAMKSTYVAEALTNFSGRFPPHKAAKETLPGFVQFQTSRKIVTKDSRSKEPQKRACREDAAKLIAELHRAAPHKTIGVLTRTNSTVASMIFMLDVAGVEVSQEGGNPLIDSAAVDLVLSALMMIEHPGDKRWRFHVQSSPLGDAMATDALANDIDMVDMLRAKVEDIGLSEAIEYLASLLAPHCDTRDTTRLRQLTQLAMNYQRNAAPRLRDFVRMVREKRVERPQSAPIRVMTVHQSKGLEFDIVVLPELDAPLTKQSGSCVADVRSLGDPPHAMTRSVTSKSWHFLPESWQRAFGAKAASELTESLCLLYVAMTRSRQALHMIIPPASKADFATKTSAALIFHALGCEEDPSKGDQILFQSGDENWHKTDAPESELANRATEDTPQAEPKIISFRPPASQPS